MSDVKKYRIYDLRTDQEVALMHADGTLADEGDPQAIAQLKELMQRELVVREKQYGFEAGDEEWYELFPEGSMCYFGLVTLRPGDAEYLPALLSCLPSLSTYMARPVEA